MEAISVKHLVKNYGTIRAVQDISFSVDVGSTFAFLGTNGAGKSTTIGCITTTRPIDSGVIRVAGHQVGRGDVQIREKIGVVFQPSLLDPLLTVKENLETRGAFYPNIENLQARIRELARRIDLIAFIDQRYGTLSGGQKRRADIARALLHKPEILFLDEPTAGLDPQSRETVWQAIHTLQQETQLTIFVTTHYMEETEHANQACIINDGQIVAQGTPQELRARYSSDELRLVTDINGKILSKLKAENYNLKEQNDVLTIKVDSAQAAMSLLSRYDSHIKDFEFRHGNMNDVFLNLTEHQKAKEEL